MNLSTEDENLSPAIDTMNGTVIYVRNRLNKPVVKSHGGTDAVGFFYSIDLCYKIVKGNLMQQIKNGL